MNARAPRAPYRVLLRLRQADRTAVGPGDEGRVLGERAARVVGRRALPAGPPAVELGLVDVQIEPALRDVEHDPVAVSDQRDRAAVERLGRRMGDARAERRAGEAS